MARRKLGFWRRLAVCVVKPVMTLFTRRDWRGQEHIPAQGGVILAFNHLSHADPFVAAHYVYDAGRWPQFLAKESLFRLPVAGRLLQACRQIPVHRGSVDAKKALGDAVDAVENGGTAVIYPEGSTTKEPQLWPMRGKTGVARLALETGAPVIPVVMWGPQQLFDPRTKKLRLRPRTPICVVAGPPVDLSAWHDAEPSAATLIAVTEQIMLRIQGMLAELRAEEPPPLWTPKAAAAGRGAA